MARLKRPALGVLFLVIAGCFGGVAAYAAIERAWIVAIAAAVLAVWMGELSYRAFR